jgi:hypothetical protein
MFWRIVVWGGRRSSCVLGAISADGNYLFAAPLEYWRLEAADTKASPKSRDAVLSGALVGLLGFAIEDRLGQRRLHLRASRWSFCR